MSRLVVTVPIEVVRDDDGFWVQIKTPTNRESCVSIQDDIGREPGVKEIWREWAKHVSNEAMLKARRPTGVHDCNGRLIYEGDLIQVAYSSLYPGAVGAVAWKSSVGAFTLQGDTEKHGPWETENLRGASKGVVIGNVFQTPELMIPAALATIST